MVLYAVDNCYSGTFLQDPDMASVCGDRNAMASNRDLNLPTSNPTAATCKAAIEGYGALCDGQECCIASYMLGFAKLWRDCSSSDTNRLPLFNNLIDEFLDPSQNPGQFVDNKWLDRDFTSDIAAGNSPSTYDCSAWEAPAGLSCPELPGLQPATTATAYDRQGRLQGGDCCKEDADCAAGLVCDTSRRTCASECTDAVFCPLAALLLWTDRFSEQWHRGTSTPFKSLSFVSFVDDCQTNRHHVFEALNV